MTARKDELQQKLQELLDWAKTGDKRRSRPIQAGEVDEIIELGKRTGHERGYDDGHWDHGQNWGDRSEFRENEFVAGRPVDKTEDDNPEPIT